MPSPSVKPAGLTPAEIRTRQLQGYYTLRPQMYYSDVAKAPVTLANAAVDGRIRELEDEILARRYGLLQPSSTIRTPR